VEDGINPFLPQGQGYPFPSHQLVLAAIARRRGLGEIAWSYRELVKHVGIHEAKLTNGLCLATMHGDLVGPGVVVGKPGPNALLPRDYIVHCFWLPEHDDSAMRQAIQRHRDLGLIDWIDDRPQRVTVSSDLRALVWDKSGGRCWYCGVQTNPFINFRVDHVVPVADNGTNELSNLVPCCHDCNASKGAKHVEAFRAARGSGLFWFEIMRSER
jgi:hypothetical protein